MACVTCDMSHTSGDGASVMHTRTGPADWALPLKSTDGGKGAIPAGHAVHPEFSTRPDVFKRTNRM